MYALRRMLIFPQLPALPAEVIVRLCYCLAELAEALPINDLLLSC